MKTRYYKILAFLAVILLLCPNNLLAQNERSVTIEAVVQDEDGQPLADAEVFSGNAYAKTDKDGRFSITTTTAVKFIIEAEGYETIVLQMTDAMDEKVFEMKKSEFLHGDKDLVNLAFRKAYKGDVVGAFDKVDVREAEKYDHTIWGSDILAGRVTGMIGGTNIRGLGVGIDVSDVTGTGTLSGNALYIVDGLPRDIQSLKMSDIESITVLKDVNASVLYGSAAMNGVVLITTKRGEAHKNSTKVTANFGLSKPKELPKYLSSADYMTYYNKNRVMDGLSAVYDDATISNYRSGNKYRYPNQDYYSDEYLRDMKNYYDVNGEFEGGNEVAKYYASLSWYSQGSLIDFGRFSSARNNIFNVRANVDLKINNWIKTQVDGVALFGQNKSGRGDYWTAAATVRPNMFAPLLPLNMINSDIALLDGVKNYVDDAYILGGNSSYTTNAFTDGYAGGTYGQVFRKYSFNNRVDFDLGSITEGLSFHTNFSFDFMNRYDQTVYNTYSVYEPTWGDGDKIVALKKHGSDSKPGTQAVGNTYFRRRFGLSANLEYERLFNDVHKVYANLIGYGSQYKEQGFLQEVKQSHIALQLDYTYNNKYMIDFSGNYSWSVKLPSGNRGAISPSVGLGWVVSNESFMENVSFINYLKLKASAGILKSDMPISDYFLYDPAYGTSGTFYWNEGGKSRSGIVSSRGENMSLGYADRQEINVGLEAILFNKTLTLDANLYLDKYGNQVLRPTNIYPSFYSIYVPYENYNEDQYKGFEIGLKYNKKFGDFSLMVGANALFVGSKRTKVSELYDADYLYREGHPVDGTWGLEALGLFQSEQEIASSPTQTFGTVRPGDIKYKDQNGDGQIDDNDQVYLRRWNPPFSAGWEIKLGYKNWTFYALGDGRMGAKNFMENSYYWIDSTDKYSEIALDSWSTDHTNAKYPRITTEAGNNNLRRSSFWLYKTDYLRVRRMQLSYEMPGSITKHMLMKNMTLFVDVTDPIRIAPNHEILDRNVGSEPQYRTFSIGLKSTF